MKILITGNQGYVGPLVVSQLRKSYPDATIVGYDSAFFAHALSGASTLPERLLDEQLFGDVRELTPEHLKGVDAVVHLAAVSNDPMGNKFEAVTHDINQQASVDIATAAAKAGAKNFVFASSCSVYGFAPGGPRKETDTLAPQTAYARSKVNTEVALKDLNVGDMTVTCLRFATACGMSDRLRLDLVLNDFVACALADNLITVLSDGSPWRPLIDVRDMARAIDWAVTRKAENGGKFLTVNAGSNQWNYKVLDLANAVANAVPGTKVSVNKDAPPDKRSYQVDFALFRELAPKHQPAMTLDTSIAKLIEGLRSMNFSDKNFRNSKFIRLKMLESHISDHRITQDLRWSLDA